MTGASFSGSILYAFGNAYGTNVYTVHKYNPATGSSSGQYMTSTDFPGLQPAVYDIAFSATGVWVARDESDSPIICYNTSGVVTNYVMGTTIPEAAGLAMDPDGYLWVSDPGNDKIYKLDISTSITDTTVEVTEQNPIFPAANPFESIAVVNAGGYSDGAVVEIFDIRGRLVHTGSVSNGLFSWNASTDPAGTYMVRISGNGNPEILRMVKTGN